MRFYKGDLPSDSCFPCVVLFKSNWDDYGYKTTHAISYYDEKKIEIELGHLKILDEVSQNTIIPSSFDALDGNYYSLGQSIEFYERIVELNRTTYEEILLKLNDIVFNEDLGNVVQTFDGFETSLLRNSEARKAYKEAKYLFRDSSEIKPNNIFKFKFETKIKNAESNHEVYFDFKKDLIPYRINALIGKNGTGKTQLLANLAEALSGMKNNKGHFSDEAPIFSRVITISYSYFDNFSKPNSTKYYSYRYCGLRNKRSLMSTYQMEKKIENSIEQIKQLNRIHAWREILSSVIEEDILRYIEKTLDLEELSSGQCMILTTITDVIANIKNESLLLFDEPELYLHPNAISNYVNMLSKLLKTFNSYAIVSTHSPIILQEIPSKRVNVFERIGNHPVVRRLGIECFGEDISIITDDVFGNVNNTKNYEEVFSRLVKEEKLGYDEILELFENNLSFTAKMFIKALVQELKRD